MYMVAEDHANLDPSVIERNAFSQRVLETWTHWQFTDDL